MMATKELFGFPEGSSEEGQDSECKPWISNVRAVQSRIV